MAITFPAQSFKVPSLYAPRLGAAIHHLRHSLLFSCYHIIDVVIFFSPRSPLCQNTIKHLDHSFFLCRTVKPHRRAKRVPLLSQYLSHILVCRLKTFCMLIKMNCAIFCGSLSSSSSSSSSSRLARMNLLLMDLRLWG